MPLARVKNKGQVTIPVEVRKALDIEKGDDVLFELDEDGEGRIKVVKRARLTDLYGALPATRPYPGRLMLDSRVMDLRMV